MKFRNGFVSNSSSASFVLAFPKDSPIELKNIEDYFGGFGEELEPEVRDSFAFEVWASQYFDAEGNRKGSNRYLFTDDEGKILPADYTHYNCTAPWDYIRENRPFLCDGHFDKTDEEDIDIPPKICKKCKYLHSEKRMQRDDDYYRVLDNTYSDELKKWLEEHKSDRIVELEIDDSEPPRRLSWEIADDITRNAYYMFKSDKHAYVSGGK